MFMFSDTAWEDKKVLTVVNIKAISWNDTAGLSETSLVIYQSTRCHTTLWTDYNSGIRSSLHHEYDCICIVYLFDDISSKSDYIVSDTDMMCEGSDRGLT
jgi:hypothetical protein